MATRYWVGGSGTWSTSATDNWATTSGGAGGASAPTSADDVVFDSASNATSYTVTVSGNVLCGSITTSGPATGTCTHTALVAYGATVNAYGNLTFSATGFAITNNLVYNFIATSGSWTITTNGVALPYASNFGAGASTANWTLGSALTLSGGGIYLVSGTLNTAGYAVTCLFFARTGTQPSQLNLSSSTVTHSNNIVFVNFTNAGTNLNAGTSQINLTNSTLTFTGAGLTFYNVSFTSTAISAISITGANTFNNLTFAGRTGTIGSGAISVSANQTLNGTLTFSAGTNATYRNKIASSVVGSPVTLTAAAVSLTDVDFADITGAGAATWSGTRLGNVGRNSGITFPAAKTVYWSSTVTGLNYLTNAFWSATSGGSTALGNTTNFPLAQDTCIFDNNSCGTGGAPYMLLNGAYSMGTFDLSAMTKTYQLQVNGQPLYFSGNIKLAASTTTSYVSGSFVVAGQSTQQLTTAGVTWNIPLTLSNASGTFQLQDSLTLSSTATITHSNGTFAANNQNITSAATFASNSGLTRTLNLGTGTWTFSSNGSVWTVSSNNLTLNSNTSTLSFTSSLPVSFTGGGFTYNRLNLGGSGAVTISDNNTITNISNSTQPATLTANSNKFITITNFSLSGNSGNLVSINSSIPGTQSTLIFNGTGNSGGNYLNIQDINATPSGVWYAANSTNSGNNPGWTFGDSPTNNSVFLFL